MQQTCPQCGNLTDANSRFCTNCGAVRETAQVYHQSWESPSAQNQAQVPSWAQGNVYQQQQPMVNQNQNGGLGFGGQGDTTAKKLITIAVVVILSAVAVFIGCIALAIITPAPISTFFWVVAVILFVIVWIIYSRIRRLIRRTIRGFGRFL